MRQAMVCFGRMRLWMTSRVGAHLRAGTRLCGARPRTADRAHQSAGHAAARHQPHRRYRRSCSASSTSKALGERRPARRRSRSDRSGLFSRQRMTSDSTASGTSRAPARLLQRAAACRAPATSRCRCRWRRRTAARRSARSTRCCPARRCRRDASKSRARDLFGRQEARPADRHVHLTEALVVVVGDAQPAVVHHLHQAQAARSRVTNKPSGVRSPWQTFLACARRQRARHLVAEEQRLAGVQRPTRAEHAREVDAAQPLARHEHVALVGVAALVHGDACCGRTASARRRPRCGSAARRPRRSGAWKGARA